MFSEDMSIRAYRNICVLVANFSYNLGPYFCMLLSGSFSISFLLFIKFAVCSAINSDCTRFIYLHCCSVR